MTFSGLERYRMTAEEKAVFLSEFQLIVSNVDLANIQLDDPAITTLSKIKGVYFCTVRVADSDYKVYAGRTESLPRRLADYKRGFQEHSPNDFKLRFFQPFFLARFPSAEFDLFFHASHDFKTKETEVIRSFKPLINERQVAKPETRSAVKQAYEKYYVQIFDGKLRE